MTDFTATDHGSVWRIEATSDSAKEHAETHFPVESWQGVATNFCTDWRPARNLCNRLADEGWEIEYR